MRIGLALGHAVLAACVLSSCGGGNSNGAATNGSTVPGTLMENPPARLASISATDFANQLAANPSTAPLLALATAGTGTFKCGVDFYLMHYATTGGKGEATTASGAIMVPTGAGCTGGRAIVLHAHGTAQTIGYNMANIGDATNEAHAEAGMVAAMYAAGQGFVVVAPNYAGYTDSTLSYHPYVNAVQNGREMIDALAAARTAISSGTLFSPVSDNGKLFLTGYSEGGFVSMAAHKAMQAAGRTVTAAVHMSGPYALEAYGDAIVLGNVALGATTLFPLAVSSYQNAYGDLYASATDIFDKAYASTAPTALPTAIPYAQLSAGGPGTSLLVTNGSLPALAVFNSTTPTAADFQALGVPAANAAVLAATLAVPSNPLFASGFGSPSLFSNGMRMRYAIDALTPGNMDGVILNLQGIPAPGVPLAPGPMYPVRKHLHDNDLRSWTPSPTDRILLCGGHDDPTVFYSINTRAMLAYWPSALISTPTAPSVVTEVDVDPGQAFASGGIAAQVTPAVVTAYLTDLAAHAPPAKLQADVGMAVIGPFASHFSITASGAVPIDPQGVLIAGVAAVAQAVAASDYTAATPVSSPTAVGSDVTRGILGLYHDTLVQPACSVAAAGFFASF